MESKPTSLAPVQRLVGQKIYALFRPNGKMAKCGVELKEVVNFLERGMPSKLWNAVFGKGKKSAIRAFEKHGWSVLAWDFLPNVEVHRAGEEKP
jgi:hypothetical protein